MKKILFSLSGLIILIIIIAGCTPVPTPDVEVTGFTIIGNYVDSTTAFTPGNLYVQFDDTKLVVRNYVDAIVDGAYAEVYRVVDLNPANAIFVRTGDILGFTTQHFGQTDTTQDTLTIGSLMMNVKPEAESLWVNKNIQSYRLDLHFTGEDGYGKHKRFDVYRSVSLCKSLKK